MYSRVRSGAPARGCGPSRLAFEVVPLPLATQSALPSRATRTEVGYQPVGMNPSGVLPPNSLTFTTATLFVSALAMNSIDPSGERLKELGVLPAGAFGAIAVPIVSTDLPASASKTETELRLALAT